MQIADTSAVIGECHQKRVVGRRSERDVLLNQIKQRKHVILQSVSTGVTVMSKTQLWQNIFDAVNATSAEGHTVTEIK